MDKLGEILLLILVFIAAALIFFLLWLAAESLVQNKKKNIFAKYLERDDPPIGEPCGYFQKINRFLSTDVDKREKYKYGRNTTATLIYILWCIWVSCSAKGAIGCAVGVIILILVLAVKLFDIMTGAF